MAFAFLKMLCEEAAFRMRKNSRRSRSDDDEEEADQPFNGSFGTNYSCGESEGGSGSISDEPSLMYPSDYFHTNDLPSTDNDSNDNQSF